MTDQNWRRKAKEALYNYTTNRLLIRQRENDIIYGSAIEYDHRYRRGGISNPTLMKAQKLDSRELQALRAEIAAVDKLLRSLSGRKRIDIQRRRMLEMVYLRGTHSLFGAGAILCVSERTIKRWNAQALEFVALAQGTLSPDDCENLSRSRMAQAGGTAAD